MNSLLLKKLAKQELLNRNVPLPNVLEQCFSEQLELISHPSKRKIACLTRRSGKSMTMGLYLIDTALKNPRSKSVYVNLTKEIAKKVMWTDIFETIILKFKIPAELVGLEIRFANGSVISLTGVDATYKEKQKLRGQKNILAVVDECQSFTQDLEDLIISIILPTLADYNGTLCMIGTPGDNKGLHYWWRLNNPENQELNKAWTYFHWTWKDNPHVRINMEQQVQELIATNPLILNTPKFKQEYLGEWVIDTDARVYKSSLTNYIDQLPSNFLTGAKYILSVDLGYNDATAFVITAYNRKFNKNMYVIESQKRSGLIISEVAEIIKKYRLKYHFTSIFIDAANKQAVEEMRKVHQLPLLAAEKSGKAAHIALLNSDLITGNVLIIKQTNQDLIQELETLIWDPKAWIKGEYKENSSQENHLCDSLLYGFIGSYHYLYKESEPEQNSDEQFLLEIEKQFVSKSNHKILKKSFWEE